MALDRIYGSTAIVTGGGSGIGAAISETLGKLGAHVVVCGRRSQAIAATVDAIRAAGGQACAVRADVAREEDVDRVVWTAVDTYGGVDILVNNAGIYAGGFIHNHTVTTWDQVMAVNLRGPFLLARAILPHMRNRRRGDIINISSESAMGHYAGDGAYGVSKHALNALSEYIQRENQELGIRVNVICPGMVVTEMTADEPGLDPSKSLYPQDIADLVVWLLSRRDNIKIGAPVLMQTMLNPWRT
jgi:NAD(P)-dependent dehydrogenase (short-subunit alcohol dehydrogenase family)